MADIDPITTISPIGKLRTCYGEKFGVPRQPGLVEEAWGELTFEPAYRNADALRGLEGFSHLWLIFLFHQNHVAKNPSTNSAATWKPLVRPPRLGGNDKIGVFASRSPFRPNPLGMSCVKLESIDITHPDSPILKLSGIDLVDGTPIIDIKPYLPYADALPHAVGGFAPEAPAKLRVIWDERAHSENLPASLRQLIESTIAADPRPAYQQGNQAPEREYGCLIEGYNIRWSVDGDVATILSCNC